MNGGKVRALAITSERRSASLPDVPTLAELGYARFHIVEWYGVFAPAGLSPAIADRLNAEINKVLQRPDVRQQILAQGQEPRPESRQAFAAMVKACNLASREVIAKAGIKLEGEGAAALAGRAAPPPQRGRAARSFWSGFLGNGGSWT